MASKPVILLVDDDERLRNAVTKVLTAEGHRVICAGSGGEALERLQTQSVALVVSDLRLPDLDGIELLKGARAAQPEVEVVVITGMAASRRPWKPCGWVPMTSSRSRSTVPGC